MRHPLRAAIVLLALTSTTVGAQTLQPATPVKPPLVPSPTVTSASPSSIALLAGATAQTVTLSGSGLDQIVAAEVQQNGTPVPGVSAGLLATTTPTQRQVHLTAIANALPRSNIALIVRVGASQSAINVPLTLEVLGTRQISQSEVFATPIKSVIGSAIILATSCGPPSEHGFSVQIPGAGYSATGEVPRFERTNNLQERFEFLGEHTIAHGLPVPHTVTEVRMCVLPAPPMPNWQFLSATAGTVTESDHLDNTKEVSGITGPRVTIKVPFQHFPGLRARGMPADPVTYAAFFGWGDPITDSELPDLTYPQAEYKVDLELLISGGQVKLGYPEVALHSQAPKWTSSFLGPGHVRVMLETYAKDRMDQFTNEIRKAFSANATRGKISSAMTSALQSKGITNVVSLRSLPGGMWEVVYR